MPEIYLWKLWKCGSVELTVNEKFSLDLCLKKYWLTKTSSNQPKANFKQCVEPLEEGDINIDEQLNY